MKPPEPCKPFTSCWCELNPNHPKCDATVVPIGSDLTHFVIIIVLMFIFKNKIK